MAGRGPHRNRRDANEPQIFAILRAHGIQVHSIDRPCDAMCGYKGQTFLVEVKDGPKAKLTATQQPFHDSWTGGIVILDSEDAATSWAQQIRGLRRT
jgi:hypothetical protein